MRLRHILMPVMVSLGLALGCASIPDPWEDRPGPRVLTSFVPIWCFAKNVAGDDAQVRIVATERGPHHFDPSPRDVLVAKRADLFLINGLMLDDPIAKRMKKGAGNSNLKICPIGEAIPESQLREGGCNCAKEGHDHDHESHGKYDPHVWLGIPEAIKMVERIRDELKEVDPSHAAGYDARATAYIGKLNALAEEGRAMLKSKTDRRMLTFHDSLFYFARTFDLTIVDSIQVAPGIDPGDKKLEELINVCTKEKVRFISVEPQYPANTHAKLILNALKKQKIDAQFIEIDPLETARPADLTPDMYETRMRANLKNLADALP